MNRSEQFVELTRLGLELGFKNNPSKAMSILEKAFNVDPDCLPIFLSVAAMEFIDYIAEEYVIENKGARENNPLYMVGKLRNFGNEKPPKPEWLRFYSDRDRI